MYLYMIGIFVSLNKILIKKRGGESEKEKRNPSAVVYYNLFMCALSYRICFTL